jgi:predicted regulator of Ras-like GTPase activity (Roadblock/LC7/MglB family)
VVSIPLSAISSAWPEVLRKEIEHLNLAGSVVAVPVEFLDTALKQGKVAFFWKQVCQWIEACPPAAFASNFAEVRLEWPLNVVAPMFLQARPKKEPKAAPLHIDIPDVFAPKDQQPSGSQPAPVQATAPAPAPAAAAQSASAAPKKVPKDLAELFGEPEKRNWTPNEIVHKTCSLPGLDGALIALQDGLLVASCMPPTWRTETIAAFLPQIFGRMHQYTRELKMGELMSVTFAVENGTLQIFNAGIIYFAALGKQGMTLPVPELNLIARELSRHTK